MEGSFGSLCGPLKERKEKRHMMKGASYAPDPIAKGSNQKQSVEYYVWLQPSQQLGKTPHLSINSVKEKTNKNM